MTPDDFRKIALALPDTVEVGHKGHPDFPVRGKIFATLGYPSAEWGMVKLAPDEQLALTAANPDVFVRVKGAWGEGGATNVRLELAGAASVREAMVLACAHISGRTPAKPAAQRKTSRKK
ncbi:MAG: MmcQ/YjbR family DNA-binding protein [Candidatus Eremiobacteraeota bacterium]|nr:MmcQ/YjbR family DNA-binding protein [Candidatus Eremiobacteraeota bacterium]